MNVKVEVVDDKLKEMFDEDDGLYCYPNKSRIIEINDKIIGFFTTHIILNKLMLEYNVVKKYRHRGLGFSFVNIATEIVSKENPDCDKIYLLINYSNDISINVATKNGYNIDSDIDFTEKIIEEMPNFIVYSKENEFYKRKTVKK